MSDLALSSPAAAPRAVAAAVDPNRASMAVWISIVAAMIGAFMAILNIQITNASLLNIEGGIGTGVDNAWWDLGGCQCMTYGDGSFFNPVVSMDVAGHELSHGVTEKTAGLIYAGESGGLNEGTSDIMGTMIEFYANNANDVPDWDIGEVPGNWYMKAVAFTKPGTECTKAGLFHTILISISWSLEAEETR